MNNGKVLKDRIKIHFKSKEWDYKFNWAADTERWGAKYETIKSLSLILDCPATSLYIPVKELNKEGFLKYQYKLISVEQKLYDIPSKDL